MALITVNESQKKTLSILILIAVVLSFVFLRNYLMLIIFSAIMAVLFNPVYNYFMKRGRSEGLASFYTFMLSMLVIIIPVVFVGFVTFFQIEKLADTISQGDYSVTLTDIGNQIITTINNILSNMGINYTLTTEQLAQNFSEAAQTFGKTLFRDIVDSFSGIFALITTAIIYIYVFLSMLKNKDAIINTIKRLNPLSDDIADLYINRVGAMTKATVRGQFIIAFMQGLASAAVIALVGPSDLFFFFLLLLTLFSVIPLGAGIITIPLGIIMILLGNVWQGIVVILNHLLIVTNIDNVMRPKLVPKTARLDPALMILAVFSGIGLFGFIGIVVGPIIMILLVTTVQIYTEVFYKIESIDRSKEKKRVGLISKIRAKL